ncbi:MAG: AIR synthase-related protein [Bacteroidia bacterium]
MDKYEKRGVSASKSEVHEAIKHLDKGLYPNAFCKILPDYAAQDPDYCNIMHADTAGTKTSLAFLYWKETGDINVWKGIAQDALVMNLDDMACAGVTGDFLISSTIGRNKNLIPGEVLAAIIEGTQEFIQKMASLDVQIHHAGGETADVGDIVRTADVGFTAFARLPREEVVVNNIQPGDVVIGLSSYGQASYESCYNSGIGSNGLTFARHEVLGHKYAALFPETYDPQVPDDLVYSGRMNLTDVVQETGMTVGEMLLSPTRTYLPVLKEVLKKHRKKIHGIIHCTGGGLTKVLHFIDNLNIVKDNIIDIPPVFRMIQKQTGAKWEEMFGVFNMGTRLEIYLPQKDVEELLPTLREFNIRAQIIGKCFASDEKKVTIAVREGEFNYKS